MSQQPLMSSFSALEFHAGHYKGTASLAAEAAWSPSDRAAILVNRFIMPEGRVSCRRHALETIVSVRSGWLFLISQWKITARRHILCAKETRLKRQYATKKKKYVSNSFAVSSFFFHGSWNFSVFFDLLNRATNLTLTCNIDIRIQHNYAKTAAALCRIGPGRSLGVGPVQIRIGLDQNTADGPDKLSDL